MCLSSLPVCSRIFSIASNLCLGRHADCVHYILQYYTVYASPRLGSLAIERAMGPAAPKVMDSGRAPGSYETGGQRGISIFRRKAR